MEARNTLLLTGAPGTGKTTALSTVAARLVGAKVRGFLTVELRESGRRVGFRIEAFDGDSAILSHASIRSRYRVGRYGVDVAALDRMVDLALVPRGSDELFIVDEIGKMECFSRTFVARMNALVAAPKPLLASIALTGHGFIEAIKRRPGVEIWTLDRENRDLLPQRLLEWLNARR